MKTSGRFWLALVALFIFTGTTEAATPKRVFTSKRYSYTLAVPRSWSVRQTAGAWRPGSQPVRGGPGVDALSEPNLVRVLVVAARQVAAGSTLGKWSDEVASLTPSQCVTKSSVPAKLGGGPAERWEIHCQDGAHVIKVAALHGNRGYLLALVSETNADRADRKFFASTLQTFTFTH